MTLKERIERLISIHRTKANIRYYQKTLNSTYARFDCNFGSICAKNQFGNIKIFELIDQKQWIEIIV